MNASSFIRALLSLSLGGCSAALPSLDAGGDGGPPSGLCARESIETRADGSPGIVCEEGFSESPALHLPPDVIEGDVTIVVGGFDQGVSEFVSASARYAIPRPIPAWLEAEVTPGEPTYAYFVYRARVRAGVIESVERYARIDDRVFQAQLAGLAIEGLASPRLADAPDGAPQWDFRTHTVPVRIRLGDTVDAAEADRLGSFARRAIRGSYENATAGVLGASGTCIEALADQGASNPLYDPSDATVSVLRHPSMHGGLDDVFLLNGAMGGGLFVSVADLLGASPPDFTEATVFPHGNPSYGVSLELQVVRGGGGPCP